MESSSPEASAGRLIPLAVIVRIQSRRAANKTPTDPQRTPLLLIVVLVIIVLGIASFLILRPRGTGATNQTNPAAPASSNQ